MPHAVPLPDLASTLRAVAAAADVGDVRVYSTSPWVVCLVNAPLSPARAEALGDEMSALAGCHVEARPLASLPLSRRRSAWEGATRL